jgi:hypothetical protein
LVGRPVCLGEAALAESKSDNIDPH